MRVLIKRPILSEKSSLLLQMNQYSVIVDSSITKIDLKEFIKNKYKVDVLGVNSLIIKPKKRRRGKILGKTRRQKKMIFTIPEDKKISQLVAS